jgi:uncharacterized protein (TIGR03067 family)
MQRLLAALATVGLLVVPGAVRADDAKKDLDKLQGTWEITEVVNSGKAIAGEKLKGGQVVFKGDEMTIKEGDDDKDPRKFTVKLDPGKKPRALDATALNRDQKGSVSPGIYELDGDALKICSPNDDSKERPKAFKSEEGSSVILLTLKRVKK